MRRTVTDHRLSKQCQAARGKRPVPKVPMNSRALIVVFSASVASLGCGSKGSLGNYTDSGGDGSTTATGGAVTSGSNSGGATSLASSEEASDGNDSQGDGIRLDVGGGDSGEDEGTVLDVGDACEAGCAIACTEVLCGPLSQHHEDGCLRRACHNDDPCDETERCYIPARVVGGCVSSGWSCDVLDGDTCLCGGDADCAGGYCVDEADFPTPAAGPSGAAQLVSSCGPDDGPAMDLRFGLEDASCGAAFGDGATVRIQIPNLQPGDTGTYEINMLSGNLDAHAWYSDGVGPQVAAPSGTVTITAFDGSVTGTYELFGGLSEFHVGGEFEMLENCGGNPQCG